MHKFTGKVIIDDRIVYEENMGELENYITTFSRATYEVIRIIDGIPLFLDEHLNRLKRSCEAFSIKKSAVQKAASAVSRLMKINGFKNRNIKILVGSASGEVFVFLGFIESHYPPEEKYDRGNTVQLFPAERRCPQVKKEDISYREKITIAKSELNVDELLIYNHNNLITEGSTSSFFYVKEDQMYIPGRKLALHGVTQEKVLEVCAEEGIDVIEKPLSKNEVLSIDAGFLTGTSIDVMPVGIIGKAKLNSADNIMIKRLMLGYTDKKNTDIQKREKEGW